MIKKSLVGYSGFVGSNLVAQTEFDRLYNSKNISDAFGTRPELLVYAGVRAEKYLANSHPDEDKRHIEQACDQIKKINPDRVVLISTIDVYPDPVNVDEDSPITPDPANAYGANRFYLETLVRDFKSDALIVRLPALFGQNLKKNFIFDLINVIPAKLTAEKFSELVNQEPAIKPFYILQSNGFYSCRPLSGEEPSKLKRLFWGLGFTAINFTDSRAQFQFYNLICLWPHLEIALKQNIKTLNMATEPISAKEIYYNIFNRDFSNEISVHPPLYNMLTKYASSFYSQDKYIHSRREILAAIMAFIKSTTLGA